MKYYYILVKFQQSAELIIKFNKYLMIDVLVHESLESDKAIHSGLK